jgi:hypothetical protein
VSDNVLAASHFQRPVDEGVAVRLAHIGEPRPETVVIDADQGIGAQQIDVVLDQHDVAGPVIGVHAAAGIAHDEQLRPQGPHHPHRQRDDLERIALVHMEAALHGDDRKPRELAAHETAAVARGRAPREVRDLLVLEGGLLLDVLDEAPQAGAQDDARVRHSLPAPANESDRFLDFVVEAVHGS